jgi:O-antigen/teichoic acid export membrane protein
LKISSLRSNVVANFAGSVSNVVFAIVFTPFYIEFLGIEAYGLIGFYITLQASISFLEMGLSRACNRELARYSVLGESSYQMMRNILRSLEVIYWIVASTIVIGLTLAAPWIASSWLESTVISNEKLEDVLTLLAWVIALYWPVGIYSGVLMGLQKQVLMNVAKVGISFLNWGGAAMILWLVQPDIEIFFQWQLLVSLCAAGLFATLAWRVMPSSGHKACFSPDAIKNIIPFAAGVGGNEVLAVILLQADKLILSAILPLKQFGVYMLATMIANAASTLASPFSTAVFPRFSQLVGGSASLQDISDLYHKGCQTVSVIIVPFSLTIAFFAFDVLHVYTNSAELAKEAASVLSVLVVAKMLHASMQIPYAMQLAYGWVKLSIYVNIASVLWILPAVYFLTSWYGTVGAALAWLIVTIGYVCIGMPLMHRKLLVGEWFLWAKNSLIMPVLSVATFLIIVRFFVDELPSGRWVQGFLIVAFGIISIIISAVLSHYVRSMVFQSGTKKE